MSTKRGFSPTSFAPLALALVVAACLSLQPVPLGNRVIADFDEDAGAGDAPIESTWRLFSPWTCGAFTVPDPNSDAGQDGGVDAGQATSPDGGQPVSCYLGPGDPNMNGLLATFDLATTSKGQQLAVEIATRTLSGTVDFTAFQQLLFDARLDPSSGTELKVELGCSKNSGEIAVDQYLQQLAPRWNPFTFPIVAFQGPHSLSDQACLAHVDSVGFVFLFSPQTGDSSTPIAGTLGLDNIALK